VIKNQCVSTPNKPCNFFKELQTYLYQANKDRSTSIEPLSFTILAWC